jgi:hypothetical protein
MALGRKNCNTSGVHPQSPGSKGKTSPPLQGLKAFTFDMLGPQPCPESLERLEYEICLLDPNPVECAYKNPEEYPTIKMGGLPFWLKEEVKRQFASSFPLTEEGLMVTYIQRAFDRVNREILTDQWDRLARAARTQDYLDPDDYDDTMEFIAEFPFPIPDPFNGKRKDRTLRTPRELKNGVCALAENLGISPSHLFQILLLDGLRSRPGTIRPELMDEIFNTFYRRLRKRLFKLARNLQALADCGALVLSDPVLEVLEEMGVEKEAVHAS